MPQGIANGRNKIADGREFSCLSIRDPHTSGSEWNICSPQKRSNPINMQTAIWPRATHAYEGRQTESFVTAMNTAYN